MKLCEAALISSLQHLVEKFGLHRSGPMAEPCDDGNNLVAFAVHHSSSFLVSA